MRNWVQGVLTSLLSRFAEKQRSKAEGEERRAVKVVSETIIKKGEMIGGFYADGADPKERGKQA